MGTDLSKKGWVIGLLSFGFLGFIIIGKVAKASAQTEPRSSYQNDLSFPS